MAKRSRLERASRERLLSGPPAGRILRAMKALIAELVQKADLSEAQAEKAAQVIRGFLGSKLPDALRGPVESALSGERVDSAMDAAKNALGGFLK